MPLKGEQESFVQPPPNGFGSDLPNAVNHTGVFDTASDAVDLGVATPAVGAWFTFKSDVDARIAFGPTDSVAADAQSWRLIAAREYRYYCTPEASRYFSVLKDDSGDDDGVLQWYASQGGAAITPPPVEFPRIDWGEEQGNPGKTWNGVAYSPTLDIFVRGGGADPGAASGALLDWSDDGVTWNAGTFTLSSAAAHFFGAPRWFPVLGLFMVGEAYQITPANQGNIHTSPDGKNWTRHTVPGTGGGGTPPNAGSTYYAIGCVPNGAAEVAIAGGSVVGRIARSVDGVTWTSLVPPVVTNSQHTPTPNEDGTVVVIGADDTGAAGLQVERSTNRGTSWAAVLVEAVAAYSNALARGPDVELFALNGALNADDFAKVWTSPDGSTWTRRTLPSDEYMYTVEWIAHAVDPYFLMMIGDVGGDDTYTQFASYDGVTWVGSNDAVLSANAGWYGICFSASQKKIVAVSFYGGTIVGTVP